MEVEYVISHVVNSCNGKHTQTQDFLCHWRIIVMSNVGSSSLLEPIKYQRRSTYVLTEVQLHQVAVFLGEQMEVICNSFERQAQRHSGN